MKPSMPEPLRGWSTHFIATVFLGVSACAPEYDNPDQPVSSNDAKGSGSIETGVEGRVLTLDDSPVVGAAVLPSSLDNPSQRIPEMAAVTDEEGHYAWSLPAGSYSMSVHAAGYRTASKQVKVAPEQMAILDFKLKPAPQR